MVTWILQTRSLTVRMVAIFAQKNLTNVQFMVSIDGKQFPSCVIYKYWWVSKPDQEINLACLRVPILIAHSSPAAVAASKNPVCSASWKMGRGLEGRHHHLQNYSFINIILIIICQFYLSRNSHVMLVGWNNCQHYGHGAELLLALCLPWAGCWRAGARSPGPRCCTA